MFREYVELFSNWVVPFLFLLIVVVGMMRGVKVYEVFVDGAMEGLKVGVQIIPYLVVILAAIALFRSSGAMDFLARDLIGTIIPKKAVHPDVLLLIMLKPLSGSGARGMMLDIFGTYGVDSVPGFMASVIQGSTETTFYVLAVYFGAVGIKNTRHTVPCALLAEMTGVVVAILLTHAFYKAPPIGPTNFGDAGAPAAVAASTAPASATPGSVNLPIGVSKDVTSSSSTATASATSAPPPSPAPSVVSVATIPTIASLEPPGTTTSAVSGRAQ